MSGPPRFLRNGFRNCKNSDPPWSEAGPHCQWGGGGGGYSDIFYIHVRSWADFLGGQMFFISIFLGDLGKNGGHF